MNELNRLFNVLLYETKTVDSKTVPTQCCGGQIIHYFAGQKYNIYLCKKCDTKYKVRRSNV